MSGGRLCEQHILTGRKKGSRKGLEHIESIGLFIWERARVKFSACLGTVNKSSTSLIISFHGSKQPVLHIKRPGRAGPGSLPRAQLRLMALPDGQHPLRLGESSRNFKHWG